MKNKYSALAVVRCGDKSLHSSWSGSQRQFDIGISYFGDDVTKSFPEARFVHRGKGGKWDGLFEFFKLYPQAIEQYDYFWLPDDDISATAADINSLFELGQRYKLDVFQPSLNADSYYSHLITLQHPSFRLRYTNFVEIMVPVVSREILKKTLPAIEGKKSGFGMDFLWPAMAAEKNRSYKGAAIIDDVCVHHTRPVGGALHQFIKQAGGTSTSDELHTTLSTSNVSGKAMINGVQVPRIRILAGISQSGNLLSGPKLLLTVGRDLLSRYKNKVQPVRTLAAVRHALKTIAP